MAEYREKSIYEYVLQPGDNQITGPVIINSKIYEKAKKEENISSIQNLLINETDDLANQYLDYSYYTYAYDEDKNSYEYIGFDILSCAYSFTNLTSYFNEEHNEFIAQTVEEITYSHKDGVFKGGIINVTDAGCARIKTDFYENSHYYIDSTYYILKVLYPTYLSLNYSNYFESDPNIIKYNPENLNKNDAGYNLLINQQLDCTDKFDSEHEVINSNVFVRFPDRKFIDYRVDGIYYNPSFTPNYLYNYDLSDDISKEALNIFNELTGTLSLNSYYISNNSYVDLTCRVLYEKDNFFTPYASYDDFEGYVNNNNLPFTYYQNLTFRYYFKKLLPMKYELEDNTYVVYLNEAIEESLKVKDNSGLINKYGPTPITITLDYEHLNINSDNIKIIDNTSHVIVGFTLNNKVISFTGTFGHEYTMSLENNTNDYIFGNVSGGEQINVYSSSFEFTITRDENRSKVLNVQGILIGTQNPAFSTTIYNDNQFKEWIESQISDIGIDGVSVQIGKKTGENSISAPEPKSLTMYFNPSTQTISELLTDKNVLKPIVIDENNKSINVSLVYSSNNEDVAIIRNSNNSTKIYAYKNGTCKIKAKFTGNNNYAAVEAEYTLNVIQGSNTNDPVNAYIKFNDKSYESIEKEIGSIIDIRSVTYQPTTNNYSVEYYSSKPGILEVINNSKLKVNGGSGAVTITAKLMNGTIEEDSDSYEINVNPTCETYDVTLEFRKDNSISSVSQGDLWGGYSLDQQSQLIPLNFYIIGEGRGDNNLVYQAGLTGNSDYPYNQGLKIYENNNSIIYGIDCDLDPIDHHPLYPLLNGGATISNTTLKIIDNYRNVQGRIMYVKCGINNPSKPLDFMCVFSDDGDNSGNGIIYDNPNKKVTLILKIKNVTPNGSGAVLRPSSNYGAINPYADIDIDINSLNNAYINELSTKGNNMVYGAGNNSSSSSSSNEEDEEFGLIQIEEMPELYLPKNLDNEVYNNIKYYSSNSKLTAKDKTNAVADIIYYDYDPKYGTEIQLTDISSDGTEITIMDHNPEYIIKPKLRIWRDGESIISVEYPGDNNYGETKTLSFKLIVKLKGTPQLSLDEDKFEIERQLASAIDEYIDNSIENNNINDPLSGFQTFQSPTPQVICEETIPISFEYSSSNDLIGTPYGDLGDILIFDVGTIKVTIKLKETKKYHSTTVSYLLTINKQQEKTETIITIDQGSYEIRYTKYVDKAIYRVYDCYNDKYKHLVFETNFYKDISSIESNLNHLSEEGNVKNYVINNITYKFKYKDSDDDYILPDGTSSMNSFQYLIENKLLTDKLNGDVPLFNINNIEYCNDYTIGYVRLNCYVVEDEHGNFGYYIFSKGLTNRLKTDTNSFIKGSNPGIYIDKHLRIILQQDSLGISDSTYPTYSENFETYGMQIINTKNPSASKSFKHAFSSDLTSYIDSEQLLASVNNRSCLFFVKKSKIKSTDYDWKKQLMFLHEYNSEDLDFQIFKTKYTSNNTDEDVEYFFTSSNPSIATTNDSGDVLIKGTGKAKITIRSTETQNFTSGEVGYVLDILEKERPILETKYNKYLYEMDTTLVENVFEVPEFTWNNSDPDAKLLFWIRDGGPSDDPDSYMDADDLKDLGLDENNPEDTGWVEEGNNDIEEDNSYVLEVTTLSNEDANEYTFTGLGKASETLYNDLYSSNNPNVEFNHNDKKIRIYNCNYDFYFKDKITKITDNDETKKLYTLIVKNGLNIESNYSSFLGASFAIGNNYETIIQSVKNKGIFIDDNLIKEANNTYTIKFYLNLIPVFDVNYTNLGYFVKESLNDEHRTIPQGYNSDTFYIDDLYKIISDNEWQVYANDFKDCFAIVDGETYTTMPLNGLLYALVGNSVIKSPKATLDANTVQIKYAFINVTNNQNNNYGSRSLNNIYDEEDYDINNSPSIVDETKLLKTEFRSNTKEIIFGEKNISKDEFFNYQTDGIQIKKELIFKTTTLGGQEIINTEERIFTVTVDEAGNISIENGLIGHVINVLVKSVETDNFKPTYLVYNVVIRSILDNGINGDGTEDGNGYSVETSKKSNTITLEEKIIEKRTNPNTQNPVPLTISSPSFTSTNNDSDLTVEYYIYDGGAIDGNNNEWYATHYFKEYKRQWNPPTPQPKHIIDIISGKQTKQTKGEQIITYTITNRYSNKSIIDSKTVSIDNNGNVTFNSNLSNRVINVMIYCPATTNYYDSCAFYNIKILEKNETLLRLPQNIFNVSQPYPYSEIFQLPEIKTNNTDEDQIKYYITARQVGRISHDTNTFIEYNDNGPEKITFSGRNDNNVIFWDKAYGHYADNVDDERSTTKYTNVPNYQPINISGNNIITITDTDPNTNTNIYPHAITIQNDDNTTNTLFTVYKNGQIGYTSHAGRYVLNVCVISEETDNFLQGYGFYNLEVDIKDTPTLGIYPPVLDVRVGTQDVHVPSPEIICSNNDPGATLSFKIYSDSITNGEHKIDALYEPTSPNTPEISIDLVGNIKIKGNILDDNTPEKYWWIKVISNQSENYGMIWKAFLVHAIQKETTMFTMIPNDITIRNYKGYSAKLPEILCNNTDPEYKLEFYVLNDDINDLSLIDTLDKIKNNSNNNSNILIDDVNNNRVIKVIKNIDINNSQFKQFKIAVYSYETTNYKSHIDFLTITCKNKENISIAIFPKSQTLIKSDQERTIKHPEIVCSNNDPECKLLFSFATIDNDDAVLTTAINDNKFKVDAFGNITVSANATTSELITYVHSTETTNFTYANEQFTLKVIEKITPSIAIFPKSQTLIKSDQERTIKHPEIVCSNNDPECKLLFSFAQIDNNTLDLTSTTNDNEFKVDSCGNITVSANATTSELITYVHSTETTNFTYADAQFILKINEKATPTITINNGNSMTLTRTVVVGSEVFPGPSITHNNTDKDVKIVYVSSDTSIMTVTPKGALVVYKTGTVDLKIGLTETDNFKSVAASNDHKITITINQQTIPSS